MKKALAPSSIIPVIMSVFIKVYWDSSFDFVDGDLPTWMNRKIARAKLPIRRAIAPPSKPYWDWRAMSSKTNKIDAIPPIMNRILTNVEYLLPLFRLAVSALRWTALVIFLPNSDFPMCEVTFANKTFFCVGVLSFFRFSTLFVFCASLLFIAIELSTELTIVSLFTRLLELMLSLSSVAVRFSGSCFSAMTLLATLLFVFFFKDMWCPFVYFLFCINPLLTLHELSEAAIKKIIIENLRGDVFFRMRMLSNGGIQ